MAKARKVANEPQKEEPQPVEEKEYQNNDSRIKELEDSLTMMSGFKDATTAAMMQISSRVDELEEHINKCLQKLESERSVRLKARDAKLLNMDQDRLNELILKTILAHFLATDGNSFERLIENPKILAMGSEKIVRLHEMMLGEIENSITKLG